MKASDGVLGTRSLGLGASGIVGLYVSSLWFHLAIFIKVQKCSKTHFQKVQKCGQIWF